MCYDIESCKTILRRSFHNAGFILMEHTTQSCVCVWFLMWDNFHAFIIRKIFFCPKSKYKTFGREKNCLPIGFSTLFCFNSSVLHRSIEYTGSYTNTRNENY